MSSEDEGGIVIKDRRAGWLRKEISIGSIIQLVLLLFAVFMAFAKLQSNYELLTLRLNLFIEQSEKEKAIRERLEEIDRKLEEIRKTMERRR
jgi:hypothetical protein